MADLKEIGKILVLLGALVGLIQGVLLILGMPVYFLGVTFLDNFVTGILAILFALIALVNSGFIKIPALEFANKWLVILIIGILMWAFASDIGGILVIIGAILMVLK
ncbi:MAG: hypothetical protein JSW61_14575 [Candidatus Thorarchaeota archaeon]|nr:MAG: hypothetical protein JSW61_14575 [Candidatus Thorarchaeota archaeon]